MDTALFAELHADMPKHNTIVTHGFAYHQMKECEEYITRLIRCAELRFPQGFKFSHMTRCTPEEEYNFSTAKKGQKQFLDYAQSDVYLVKLIFTLNGAPIKPKFLYLPFVGPAGIITIGGNKFCISPVLADVALSAGDDNIFAPLNLDKLTFRRILHHYMENDKRVAVGVVYSEIYHLKRKPGQKKTINAVSTIAHYLFAKFGISRVFSEFANATVVYGNSDVVNTTNYPEEDWVICRSFYNGITRAKPTGIRTKYYIGPDIRLAFRRTEYTPTVSSLVAGFFYVADRFPETFKPEYLDDIVFWRVSLGHIIFATDESEGKLLNKIEPHIESLDGYIDGMSQEWFAEDKIYISNIYELFMEIINTYSVRTATAASTSSTMYGKRLMVLRYVLIDIIKSIFKMMFALQNSAKKGPLTEKDIENILKMVNTYQIFRINHKHAEVASISSPSACMSFKTTANIVQQASITTGRSAKTTIVTSANFLDASIAEVGQYNNMPKGEPTGRKRINPFVELDERGIIKQRPDTAGVINAAQEEIRRR